MKTLPLAVAAILSVPFAFAQPVPAPPAAPAPAKTTGSASDPAAQLSAARKELMLLRNRHGDKHPAVLKQVRRVAELQKKVKATAESELSSADKPTQLEAAKRELARLREHFTDEHPVVKSQLRKVAELEKAIAAGPSPAPAAGDAVTPTGR